MGKGSIIITTTIVGDFKNPIGLSASGAPAGTEINLSRASIPSPGIGSSVLNFSVGNTSLGTYPITVMASSGSTQHSVTVALTVVASISLPTGYGWHQLANTKMKSVCLGNVSNGMYSDASMTTTTNYNFNCNQVIPWSGGAADDSHQRFIVWGGGHSDYAGNEVSALNLSGTPSWQTITAPTFPVPYVWDGNDWEGLQPYFVLPTNGGQPQPGATPSSRHTYNGVQYVPYQNKLYAFGGAVANGGYFSSETWSLDMSKATWTLLGPPYSLAPNYPTGAYNPNTGHIVMHDKNWNLLDFDPSTGHWTTLTGSYHVEDGTTAAIDPANNLFVVVGAAGTTDNLGYPSVPTTHTVQVFPLTPPYAMQTWSDPSCDLTYRSGGLAWDSALGLMVGYPGGGNQVYFLNTSGQDVVTPFGTVHSHQCLDVPISLNPSPVKGVDYPQDPEGTGKGSNLGIYGRFAYFPSIDQFAIVNDRTQNAWTLQLTGGSTTPNYALSISPGTVAVTEGSQGTSVISTTVSGGFNNAITLSTAGVPQGVTISFSPATIAAPGAGSSTVTVSVPSTFPVGTYPFVVSAFGGGDTINQNVTLIVTTNGQPDFTITPTPSSLTIGQGNQGTSTITTTLSGSFNSAIALSASGTPSGTTVSFNPQTIPAPGAGNSTMTIIVGSSTPMGTYPITVTGNGGGIQRTATVTLTVGQQQQPGFTISAAPSSLTIPQGNGGASGISTVAYGGFNSAISLSASGIPSGTSVSFNPQTIPAPGTGASGMIIIVGSNTPVGTYPITVTGSGGGVKQSTTVTVMVVSQQQPNFSISASPSSLSVQQGNQGTSTITTTAIGTFNSAITLSASGTPSGTSVSFNPNPIPAPGTGSSTMTITVGSGTPTGTYPITVTGNGGGIQQNTTMTLTVTSVTAWQGGFDFRNTPSYVTDPSGDTYVLPTTAYPTKSNGVTFGWANTSLVQGRDRSQSVDPRLAGMNFVSNGAPAKFNVDVPSSGTYNLSLAMGDEGYAQCTVQCQVQFLDGSTVLATISGGTTSAGYFYDAKGKSWSAAAWPGSNLSQQVTLTGTRLTVVVGSGKATGDYTPIAFLGVAQVSGSPNYSISASPSSLSVAQGSKGTSTVTTIVSGGFNSAITLSASGLPSGTTVSFNPNPIPAPGSGNSTMTITVGSNTPVGTYPITVTGNGGGIQQSTTVTLTVTASATFTISASPSSLSIAQGSKGTSTITTSISGGFNSAITLSASGMPSGTTVSFNPNPIPAPGSGNSTMTITVGSSTATGTYPITVTGNGGGIQQNTTVTLTVTAAGGWQKGFDFRNTSGYVTDPSGDTYVLPGTAYPTKSNGVTFGWVSTSLVTGRDRSKSVDPRLAGINFVNNGSPATFNVDLPSAGTYSLALAMGDAGYQSCWVQCQIQFLDGSTVLATVTGGSINAGYFYDAKGKAWSAAAWPNSNVSQQVTLTGTRLTVVVGTSRASGDSTPIAFLGLAQLSGGSPNYTISASPASLSVQQGDQGTSTITTAVSGGFNSAITLSASGVPSGTTVSFNPNPIPAPGSGNSTMTITVGSSTPVGTYPITVTGNGGGVQQNTTVMLTVTAQQANYSISASPSSLSIQQGNQGTSTITTTGSGGFNSSITLSASGAPSGTTVSFSPNPIPAPGSGNSTMTITVGSSTATGTYPVTVTGNGGGIQQNITVTLTVTSSGGGGSGNGIVVYSTSGSPQTNRFVSIGRFFKQGDIPHFAQAVVGGSGLLTQCDVKNRWADGSLKFAIISFIVPNVAKSGTQVTFQDQATGNNSGYLAQSDMLNAAYDFDGGIQLTGTRSPSISARSMLQAGNFTYWLQGPIVTAVIIEDRTNRSFDVNTDGGAGNPLHPIFEAWFYPQTHQVEIGFTLENSWASSTAANSARNQIYALTLKTGFNSPSTQLVQSAFTHFVFSRWRRSFWVDSTPASIQIDYNWPYLASTTAYAHFNPSYTPTQSDLAAMYSVYTNEPAARLTIPGIDQLGGSGGIVNYDESINAPGYSPWIGVYSQWDVDYLMTGDSRMQKMMTDNADLSGRFPIFFREADHYAGTGMYFDAPSTGSVDPYGHVVSINSRQYATLNLANLWDYSCNNNGADLVATALPGDGSGWYTVPGDTSHMPDFAYVPYTLTGKYYYLEHEMMEAGYATGHGVGCYNATASYGREGHYGILYSVTRELAWALRTMAYASFIAPDGAPEGPYFASKVINNIAMIEGEHGLPLTVSGADPTWAYNWGGNYFQFSQVANPSPLSFWRMGDCQDGTTTCYVANGNGANNNINATVIQSAESGFMSSFIDIVLGMVRQLGIVDTTSILQRDARRNLNILLNPAVNHYLVEQYVYPTTLVGTVCKNPANPGCQWISDWGTYQAGYLSLPVNWSNTGVDYGAEAASALSFMTNLTVDGYNGLDAWNFFTTSDAQNLGVVYHNEPQWSISPLQ